MTSQKKVELNLGEYIAINKCFLHPAIFKAIKKH